MDVRPALDLARLRHDCIGADRTWRSVDVVDQTGSTNADLLARARDGQDIGGAVLAAEHQSAGRGRHGRVWSAPPRSAIAVSVGIAVDGVPASAWGWLPLAVGAAVVDAVGVIAGVDANLKWPNDVLVGGEKLAGILAEVAAPQPVVVVGLGLNVSMTADERPNPAATSLALLGHADVDRTALLVALLTAIDARIRRWRANGGVDPELDDEYRCVSTTLGTRVRVSLPGDRWVVGVARDVDELGRLLIDTDDGPMTVAAGDVTHLRGADGSALSG